MTSEMPAKLAKLGQTYAAIERAKAALAKAPWNEKPAAAVSLQQLQREARELRSLLPKPKLVVNNE